MPYLHTKSQSQVWLSLFLETPSGWQTGSVSSDSGRPSGHEGGGQADIHGPQLSPRTGPFHKAEGRVTEQEPLAAPFCQTRPKWRWEGMWMQSQGTNKPLEKQEGHSETTRNTWADSPAQRSVPLCVHHPKPNLLPSLSPYIWPVYPLLPHPCHMQMLCCRIVHVKPTEFY